MRAAVDPAEAKRLELERLQAAIDELERPEKGKRLNDLMLSKRRTIKNR